MKGQEGQGPCNVCGDDNEGWKHLIAACCVCKESREHVFCMKILRRDVPTDWVCEECVTTSIGSDRKEDGQGSSLRVHHDAKECITGIRSNRIEVGQDYEVAQGSSQRVHYNVEESKAGTAGSDRREVGQGSSQRVHQNAVTQSVRTNRQKAVKTGKTKFLSEEEVKKLHSGSMKESCSKPKIDGKSSSPVSPKFLPFREKPIPRMIRLGSIEAPHRGKMQASDTQQPRTFEDEKFPTRERRKSSERETIWKGKHAIPVKPSNKGKIGKMNVAANERDIFSASVDRTKNKALLHSSSVSRHTVPISERKACVSHMKDLSHDECNITLPVKEVKTAYADCQNFTKEAPPTDPPSTFCSLESNYDVVAEPKNFGIEISDLLDILPELRLYRPYAPALQLVWNGGFDLKDFGTTTKFYEGFQAHPPMAVHRKAYEFSQKMPSVIQVKLLPRNHVWAHLFQDGDPQFDDIALYFFPVDNDQRSKETHASLINLLEIRDSVMLSYIDGVKLLILTSKQFDVKLQDAISRSGVNQFLWGIFLNGDYKIENVIPEFPSLPALSNRENSNDSNRSCGDNIDLEIGMVGGQELGNVSRKSSGEDCKDSNKKIADQNASKEMGNKKNALKSPIQEARRETKEVQLSQKVFQKASTDIIPSRHCSINTLSKGAVEERRVVQPVMPENTSPQKMQSKEALLQSYPIENAIKGSSSSTKEVRVRHSD